MAGEIPPGDAVGDEGHRRIRPQQRADGGGDAAQRRHLGADHHRILRAELGRVGGGARAGCMSPSGGAHGQPARASRRGWRRAPPWTVRRRPWRGARPGSRRSRRRQRHRSSCFLSITAPRARRRWPPGSPAPSSRRGSAPRTPASRASRRGTAKSASISISRPASRSCRIEGCARSFEDRAMRASGARRRSASPTRRRSPITSRAMRMAASRTAGPASVSSWRSGRGCRAARSSCCRAAWPRRRADIRHRHPAHAARRDGRGQRLQPRRQAAIDLAQDDAVVLRLHLTWPGPSTVAAE